MLELQADGTETMPAALDDAVKHYLSYRPVLKAWQEEEEECKPEGARAHTPLAARTRSAGGARPLRWRRVRFAGGASARCARQAARNRG